MDKKIIKETKNSLFFFIILILLVFLSIIIFCYFYFFNKSLPITKTNKTEEEKEKTEKEKTTLEKELEEKIEKLKQVLKNYKETQNDTKLQNLIKEYEPFIKKTLRIDDKVNTKGIYEKYKKEGKTIALENLKHFLKKDEIEGNLVKDYVRLYSTKDSNSLLNVLSIFLRGEEERETILSLRLAVAVELIKTKEWGNDDKEINRIIYFLTEKQWTPRYLCSEFSQIFQQDIYCIYPYEEQKKKFFTLNILNMVIFLKKQSDIQIFITEVMIQI